MSHKKLRLPLPRRPDPVLDARELDVLATLAHQHVQWIESQTPCSEALLRTGWFAETALVKLREAGGRPYRAVPDWPVTDEDIAVLRNGADPQTEVADTPERQG